MSPKGEVLRILRVTGLDRPVTEAHMEAFFSNQGNRSEQRSLFAQGRTRFARRSWPLGAGGRLARMTRAPKQEDATGSRVGYLAVAGCDVRSYDPTAAGVGASGSSSDREGRAVE